MYWAEALANQNQDAVLKETFSKTSKDLQDNESKIIAELAALQGKAHNIGGYYLPNEEMADNAMKPNATFNSILDSI
jgi:isocitrate dehydrogenase